METSIQIDDREVLAMLRAAPLRINRANRAAMNDATALLLRDLKTYPPTRPGQTYVRTRTLGRSWTRKIAGSGVSIRGVVGSSPYIAPYNRWVQDEARQAWMHRGRWVNTVQGVRRHRTKTVQNMFRARLRQFMGR